MERQQYSTCPKYKVKNEKIGWEGARVEVGTPLRRLVASAIIQERNDEIMEAWTGAVAWSGDAWILDIF